MQTRARAALALATLAWCLLAVGTLVAACGPISAPHLGISISSSSRLLVGGVLCVVAAMALRRSHSLLLHDLSSSAVPYVSTAVLTMTLVCGVLLARGATSVGGADSAGYLTQARRWRQGALRVPLPLPSLHVPNTAWIQSSLGFRPDPTGTRTVPTYPPGLPLVQAAALSTGGEPMAVTGVPLMAAVGSLAALLALAMRAAGPRGAAVAVTAIASTPVFLFQALQPMSDVPALAAWLLALALAGRHTRGGAVAAACCVALAILVRPNLAPLVLPVLWHSWAPALVGAPGSAAPH